jgi:DNA polymerase (family 10)
VRRLWQELGIESLDQLKELGEEGKIAALKGFGKKSEENILDGIAELKSRVGKMRLDKACRIAEDLLAGLRAFHSVERAEITGRLRRGSDVLDRVDLLVQCGDLKALADELRESDILSDLRLSETSIDGSIDQTYHVRIHVADRDAFPVVWHTTTGSTDYRFMISIPLEEQGYHLEHDRIVRDGKAVPVESESEIFDLASCDVIPPEMREGIDEVRLALDHKLPTLIEESDIRGVIHAHSQWSDGRNSIEEMANEARSRGYEYLLITDHSKAAFYANGLDEKRLEKQAEEIAELNRSYDPDSFRILHGIECDILADGSLDLSDDALASLDCVIAAVHSNFNLSEKEQTDRVCKALENRHVSILAHPTGRLLLSRAGYPIDLKRVIEHAAAHGKSIEVNANPYRLDLDWRMLRIAHRKGIRIGVCPDAHSLADIGLIRYGVVMARKAGLAAADVLNTLPVDRFIDAVGH